MLFVPGMQKLDLRKFKPGNMQNDSVILIIGKRRTGKSWIARDILYHKQKIPVGVVISGTEEGNGFYRKYVPDSFVYSKYDAEVLKRVLTRQKTLVTANDPVPNAFVVLDDCGYDKKMFQGDTPLREMLFNGRHWKLFQVITLQYIMDMPPGLRQNIDYVIVLKDNVLDNLRKLHKYFFGVIDNFNDFAQIMKQITDDHGALVLDNTSTSSDLSNMLYWYKAKERRFKMGSSQFWQQHNVRYNPNSALHQNEDEISAVGNRNTNVVVNRI